MNRKNRRIGQWGEKVAVDYLLDKGYQILARNVHSAAGEIDIVAVRGVEELTNLVFVEVKTRTSSRHGFPEEAFTKIKYRHLLGAIQTYLESNPGPQSDWQIDVIAVLGSPQGENPQINHFEGIVMPDERQ